MFTSIHEIGPWSIMCKGFEILFLKNIAMSITKCLNTTNKREWNIMEPIKNITTVYNSKLYLNINFERVYLSSFPEFLSLSKFKLTLKLLSLASLNVLSYYLCFRNIQFVKLKLNTIFFMIYRYYGLNFKCCKWFVFN